MLKRIFDVTVSASILTVSAPVMLGTALMIKKKLGSPVIFKQLRPGKNEVPFEIYKFRSMMNEEVDQNGKLLSNEDRLTNFGKKLRKTSLDELPQLVNVLKGDLSLVGPRPLRMEYLKYYNTEQKKRHLVTPGITGWAQVNGRNAITWEERFQLDVWYVENQSFTLDLYILFKTVTNVLKKKDVNASENTIMEKFTGTPEV